MRPYKVSIVSYLNTTPFIYGFKRSPEMENMMDLSLDIPSECARKLKEQEVDIGLIPVAAIPKVQNAEIISDYGIAADGKVHSVLLCSEVPVEQIETIVLDYQSRTSVALCQMLCADHWKIKVKFVNAHVGYETKIKGSKAAVIIGDRTFNLPENINHTYDLSDAWKEWTGLAFVFAAWVANKPIEDSFKLHFNAALKKGLNQMEEAIASNQNTTISKARLRSYLKDDIHFHLNESKLEGMKLFLKKLDAINLK